MPNAREDKDRAAVPVYQFGFLAFDQFSFADDTGQSGVERVGAGAARGFCVPGARFWLNPGGPATTTVWVRHGEPAMTHAAADDGRVQPVVAAASPFGTSGARVGLDCRIIARSNRVPDQDHVFHMVSIDDVKVGVIGEIPPDPDLHYTIVAAIDPLPGDALRLLGLNGPIAPDDAPVGPAGWASLFGLAQGTLIDTPDGPRKIEELRVGDLVTTLDNGSQPLRWIGSRAIPREVFLHRPELRPVLFEAAACGNIRPLLVLPGHRMLLHDWRAEVFFGEEQVLIAAKALVNGNTIRQVVPQAQAQVTFCHLLFDRHEVILAEGALFESFHPGKAGLLALDAAQRQEIAALFPHMPLERRRAAFPIVGPAEARMLALPG